MKGSDYLIYIVAFTAGLFFLTDKALGQNIYPMGNQTVSDCEGYLLDSGNGAIFGHYDHNENYTFTICVPEADKISLNFISFCTEEGFDFLRIFDGPDTFATQIGPAYSGTQSPGYVESTDGCLTVHFISDPNVTCTGWQAVWDADIESPEDIFISAVNPLPSCSTSTFILNIDKRIPCTSIHPSAMTINGPAPVSILQATPVNCTDDSSSQISVQLDQGMTESGLYEVFFQHNHQDVCDSIWELIAIDSLWVLDCPITAEPYADRDTVCPGECTNIFANPGGGDLSTYHFAWNQGLPDYCGPLNVCPLVTTTYIVTVTDEKGNVAATDSITIYVRKLPEMPADMQVCESDPAFNLTANPPGGFWTGNGITDGANGTFLPSQAGQGIHPITYQDPLGCSSQMQISTLTVEPGPNEAACPGSSPFMVDGYEPSGGVWSGPFISPAGLFSPVQSGTFTITYTVNGCSADKDIMVDDPVLPTTIDTVCESSAPISIPFFPGGGIWSGPGITDSLKGIFDPDVSAFGLHTLYYNVHGCVDSMQMYVVALSIGGNIILCPDGDPIWLGSANPPGGIWSGMGVIDPDSGIYDPGLFTQDVNDIVTYTYGGCSKDRSILVRETVVGIDSAWFCNDGPVVNLDWDRTRRRPYNGVWSGPGVIEPSNPGKFHPASAGPGAHTLYYEANGCMDSIIFVIYDNAIVADTAVCESAEPFNLKADRKHGTWSGPGIIDSSRGTFHASAAGLGSHFVYYLSPQGCLDSMKIEVFRLGDAKITGLKDEYCYLDSAFVLDGIPSGGYFTGPGAQDSTFNPLLAGQGSHFIEYEVGSGGCFQRGKALTTVSPPLVLIPDFESDTICEGSDVILGVRGSGGTGGPYTYLWENEIFNTDSIVVEPHFDHTYKVFGFDGCSQPDTAEINLYVKDGMHVTFSAGDSVCPGELGYVIAHVREEGEYFYEWHTDPPQFGDSLIGYGGIRYYLSVTDLEEGCITETSTFVPGYEYVLASFSPNPNDECITTLNPEYTFLDYSRGAVDGYWYFGDGDSARYHFGENPSHLYRKIGNYQVRLIVWNSAGCIDTMTREICVMPEKPRIHLPSAFSPNGDQVNDEYKIGGLGFLQFQIQIFNRWGKVVYQSSDPQAGWDGTYGGKPAPEGVYSFFIHGYMQSDNAYTDYGPELFEERGSFILLR